MRRASSERRAEGEKERALRRMVRALRGVAGCELAIGVVLMVINESPVELAILSAAAAVTMALANKLERDFRKHGPDSWRFRWRSPKQ